MESKKLTIWVVLLSTFTLASICLALRLFSRRLRNIPFWWDDFFAIICYMFAIAWLIICPIWITNGLGLHIADVKDLTVDEAIMRSRLILFVAELIYAFALYFAKVSILYFYWRLFAVTGLRIPIIILMGVSHLWIIIRTFMTIFHCVPVQAFWNMEIINKRCDIDDKKLFFGSVLVHLLIDVAILILPIFQIGKLQLHRLHRFGAMAMFLFGSIICICAIVIIAIASNFDTTSIDITWNVANIIVWATAEINLVTVSACFPSTRPAFIYLFGRWLPVSSLNPGPGAQDSSHPYSYNLRGDSARLSKVAELRYKDEGSSTHQLTCADDSIENNDDFDAHGSISRIGMSRSVMNTNFGQSPGRGNSSSIRTMVKKDVEIQISQGLRPHTAQTDI